jgi:hypothetical protein
MVIFQGIHAVHLLMRLLSAARNQRGALTQAGAGIAASRRSSGDFARSFIGARGPSLKLVSLARATPARSVPLATKGMRVLHRPQGEDSMIKRFAPLAFALALLAGCALSSHPKIAELKYNPGRYQNRSVTVDGVVTSSWGVPLMPLKLYKVNDGTGEVTVVSNNGRVPTKGAHVRVKGRVKEFATFGGHSVGLHLQQQKVSFRGY